MDCGKEIQKNRHASHLFNEMSKFQKCGILCDITIPGQLRLVQAHRVVLESVRTSESDHLNCPPPTDATGKEDAQTNSDDVFWVDEAYSSCDDTMEDQNSKSDSNSHTESAKNRLWALDNFRRKHCLCDVTFETNFYTCDAHKVVLAASSDYFRAMFTCGMKEHESSRISLKGVEGSYVKRVFDYIYSGELSFYCWEDGVELLKMAVFYQIPSMIDHCTAKLLSLMNAPIACELARQGRELALKSLFDKSIEFIHDHFFNLDDGNIPIESLHPEDLLVLLQSDCLGRTSKVGSEKSVLRIVQRWLLTRDSLSPPIEDRILSYVRFSLISPDEVMSTCKQTISECSEILNRHLNFSSILRRHLLKALNYHNCLHIQPLLQSKFTNIRTEKESWVAVDGVLASSPIKLSTESKFLSVDNPARDDAPIRDPFHCVLTLNGFVFVLGGTRHVDEGFSREVLRYDPRLDKWVRVAPMLVTRGDFVAVTYGCLIFVIGGRNRSGALKSCECYNPSEDTWHEVSSLPEGIYMAAGIVANERIYLTGGFNNYDTVGSSFCYDPNANAWEEIHSPMMSERGYHVIAKGHDGRLWVVGGIDNPFSGRNVWEIEALDLDTRTWVYVGQILPVKLLLSTIRLNVAYSDDGNICISAVTCPEKYCVLEFNPKQNMWLEMKTIFSCVRMDAPT